MPKTNKEQLEQSLEWLLEEEGGWSNHPHDRGGQTMYGVTQITYNGWRDKVNKPRQTVRSITKDEAFLLYYDMFWKSAHCEKLPWPISYIVFDAAVNSGVSRSIKWLQQGLRTEADGLIGPRTIKLANEAVDNGDAKTLVRIIDARINNFVAFIKRDPSQQVFLLGWWRRTQNLLARVLLTED